MPEIIVTIIDFWSQSLTKFEQRLLTREFFKQNLTEEKNGYLDSGCVRDWKWSLTRGVAAMRELNVGPERKNGNKMILLKSDLNPS